MPSCRETAAATPNVSTLPRLAPPADYLAGLHLHPLTVVGVEGALGAAAMAGLVMPLAQRLPGADGRGLHEDSWDTLHMLAHSGRLRAVAACYVGVAGAFNLAGGWGNQGEPLQAARAATGAAR